MDGWMDGPADSIENTDIYIYPCCAVTGKDAAHGQIRSYPWVWGLEQHNEHKTVLTRLEAGACTVPLAAGFATP